MSTPDPSIAPDRPDDRTSIDRLRRELATIVASDELPAERSAVAELVADVTASLFEDATFTFDEDYVKGSLDELLLLFVILRETDTHGKRLLDDLAAEFDTQLSPGTVYPRLHELCEAGLLEQYELVRTKEYRIADREIVRARLAAAARQHLALGAVFHAALAAMADHPTPDGPPIDV